MGVALGITILMLIFYLHYKFNKFRYEDNIIEEIKRCDYYLSKLYYANLKDKLIRDNILSLCHVVSGLEEALKSYDLKNIYEEIIKLLRIGTKNDTVFLIQKRLLNLVVASMKRRSLLVTIMSKFFPESVVYDGNGYKNFNKGLHIYFVCLKHIRIIEELSQ